MFGRRHALPDPQEQVTQAINRLQHGNKFLLRACQTFAFFLIIATSTASLISLGQTLLQQVLAGHGDAATDANLIIIFFLVLAMDTAMIYAATMIRINQSRGFPAKTSRIHIAVVISVAALEAATYIYMMWLYEQPHTLIAWALIIGRGLAVPCLSVYLSMTQPITIQTEDISHMTEIFSGVAVLRDIVGLANETDLSTGKRILIYKAAGTHSPDQQQRLTAMYRAVMWDDTQPVIIDADEQPTIYQQAIPDAALANFDPNGPTAQPDFVVVHTSAAPAQADAAHMEPVGDHNVTPLRRFAPTTGAAAKRRARKGGDTPAE